MDNDAELAEIRKTVLVHLYNSIVKGSLGSVALFFRTMKNLKGTANPRFADLRALYDLVGTNGRHEFYAAVVAIAEFVLYKTLDFIETYNQFESEHNTSENPRLDLIYKRAQGGAIDDITISNYVPEFASSSGLEGLRKLFKEIARNPEMTEIVNKAIAEAVSADARSGKQA